MKNTKKVILFLGAISLVAFGSFSTIGNKSNKNTVSEVKEKGTDKKENKKVDAVAEAVENNGQAQNPSGGQPAAEVTVVEGTVQDQPVEQVARNKQSQKKNKKSIQKNTQTKSEVKENAPAEVAPVVKEAPKTETKAAEAPVKKAETKSEPKAKEKSSSSSSD
jgi:hypothetical protein